MVSYFFRNISWVLALLYPLVGNSREDVKLTNEQECFSNSCGSASVELLYFQAIEDGLRYGETIPLLGNSPPTRHSIDQEWAYDPGFRATLSGALHNELECGICWTRFHTSPPKVSQFDESYGIFVAFTPPHFASTGNNQAKFVKGSWTLTMNIVDLELKKSFYIRDILLFRPIAGIQGCLVKQRLNAHYQQFFISFPTATTPQTVHATIRAWGVGPEVGLETTFLGKNTTWFDVFFKFAFSSMLGHFNTRVFYEDLLNSSADASLKLKSSPERLFSTLQLQIALAKKYKAVDFLVGWETQLWFRQLRLDFINTLPHSPVGYDLTLSGPFAKFALMF